VRREIKARLAVEDVSGVAGGVSEGVAAANARRAVDDAAARVVQVTRELRRHISDSRQVAFGMVTELREAAANREELEAAIEQESRGNPKKRVSLLKAVSLQSRSGVIANPSGSSSELTTES